MGYTERIDRQLFNKKQQSFKKRQSFYSFEDIIGTSPALKQSISFAQRVADSGHSILLNGESGTGKELFAQAIHNHACPEGPFVAINCAAIPRSLIESELFGYEGGAFTGANKNGQPGKIEAANGGTLFLDEIGDMPLEVQPVLLRVLEDKKIVRISSYKDIPVNFRLITATNRNLLQMVKEKKFRNDLFYRLSVFKVHILPLRDRTGDILPLAHYFIEQICSQIHRPIPRLTAEACAALLDYSWPGNIRQLKNSMLHAVYMAETGVIKVGDLPDEIKEHGSLHDSANMFSLEEMEKRTITQALSQGYNKDEAAHMLGISKTTLYRKIKEYGIVLP